MKPNGHLNVLTPDHKSVVTGHGKHDRVVAFQPSGDELYARVDLKWKLGEPTPDQILTVARKHQDVKGKWELDKMERYPSHMGDYDCIDVYFKRRR